MRHALLIASTALVASMAAHTAPAMARADDLIQGAPDVAEQGGADGAEEIIVTAQKRGESLQRVAAAVTAVSGDNLVKIGVTDQAALGKVAPGLLIGAQTGFAISFLRGVGQTQAAPNNPAAVALHLNGVYLPAESGFTPLYDMERVEVLPGPQGTLYGFSAAGGAINFITKKPTDDYSASFNVEAGNYDAVRATAALNVPLGSGIAVRVAGLRQVHDGYLSNGLNDQDMWSGRATLSYDGDGPFSGNIMVQRHHEGGTGNSAIAFTGDVPNPAYPDPSDPYKTNIPNYGQNYEFDSWLVSGEFNIELSDSLKLSYVPGFARVKDRQDLQFLTLIPGTIFRHRVTQYTQELKLSGENDRGDWLMGLYWLRAPNHYLQGAVPFLGTAIIENDLTSYAGFAEYRVRATDNLTLVAGARYSHDRFEGRNYNELPPNPPGNPQDAFPEDSRGRFDFKLGINYQVTPDSLLYGVVQTGYIAAGFDQNANILNPSKLTSFTLGSKNRFLDGILTANLELFYYDYKDFQLQFNDGFVFGSESVPARIMGGELQLGLNPGPDDSLTFSALVQNAEMLEKTGRYLRNGLTTSTLVNVHGYQLPYAPTLTLRGSWSHSFQLGGGQRLVAQANILYSSNYWQSFTHDLYTNQKAYTKTDASLIYHARDDRWTLGAWVRNIENVAVIVGSSKSQGPGLTGAPYLQAPRTYGVTFGANF
jgi:iron complex outermembrane receptor protein